MEVGQEGIVGLSLIQAAHEDHFVPARGALDQGHVRTGDPEQLRQETLRLGVGPAVRGRGRDP